MLTAVNYSARAYATSYSLHPTSSRPLCYTLLIMVEGKLKGDFANVEREYQRSVRVVDWRPKLVTAGFVLWAVLDVALIIFFVVNVVLYIVSGSFRELREVSTVAQNAGAA